MNAKRQLFALYYITPGKTFQNATQSAIAAGYSPDTAHAQGQRLSKYPEIRDFIRDNIEKLLCEKDEILTQKVLDELKAIALSDIGDFVSIVNKRYIEGDGPEAMEISAPRLVYKDTEDLDTRAIQSVSQTSNGAVSIKLHDKKSGLEMLGKFLQMWQERVEVTETVIDVSRVKISEDQD